VSGVTFRNNVITGAQPLTNNLLNVNDTSRVKSAEAMGVSADFDAYGRAAASYKYLVAWSSYPAAMRVFTNVTDFTSKTGQEANGTGVDVSDNPWYIDQAAQDFRVAPGSTILGRSTALPTSVASALGLPAGTVLDPGAP
jgi:hypothetical protein